MSFKQFYLFLLLVLLTSACSSDDAVTNSDTSEDKHQDAIALGVYTGGYVSTRGAVLNNTADLANAGGFRVFCYNTGTTPYAAGQTSFAPSDMYNQLVTSSDDGATWTYSPTKYWPNDAELYTSFFAYAPSNSSLITPSLVSAKGDPAITYSTTSDANAADILWADPAKTMNLRHQYPAGNPTQQTIDSKVIFNFKHAMSMIGGSESSTSKSEGLTAILDIDKDGEITGGIKPADTKVTIKSIKIRQHGYRATADGETTTDAPTDGTLDLATGKWNITRTASTDRGYYTIESSGSSNTLNTSLAEPTTVSSFDDLPTGVGTTAQNVYDSETSPFLIIPDGTIPVIEFTVTYIVRTKDANLSKGYSEVEQTLTRYVVLNAAAEAGKRYNIQMHFGLNSLKFSGNAVAWDFNSEVHYDDKGKNPNTTDQYILDVEEGEPTPEDQPYLSKKNRW